MSIKPCNRGYCILIGLVYLVIVVFSFFIYTYKNERPAFIHPDELGKVTLIVKNKNEFYHPLLLLNSVRVAKAITHAKTPREIVVIGRTVSAVFMVLSIICFIGAAYLIRGHVAAWFVGIGVGSYYPVMEHAHYFKEDAAMIFGISAVVVALVYYARFPSRNTLIILGSACGLVASAKYIGLIVVVVALIFVLTSRLQGVFDSGLKRAMCFLAGFILIFAAINFQMITQNSRFRRGVSREVKHVTTQHKGLSKERFSSFYINVLNEDVNRQIIWLPAACVYLLVLYKGRRGTDRRVERFLLLWPLLMFGLVHTVPVQLPRYVFPIGVWLMFAAGLGFFEIFNFLKMQSEGLSLISVTQRRKLFLWCISFAGLMSVGYVVYERYRFGISELDAAANPECMKLAEWVDQYVPKTSKIIADRYAYLQYDKVTDAYKKQPPLVFAPFWMGDIGSVDAIRSAGYDYVVTCEENYGRLFDPLNHASSTATFVPSRMQVTRLGMSKMSQAARVERARSCYLEVFNRLEMIWPYRSPAGAVGLQGPPLRVYKIGQAETRP